MNARWGSPTRTGVPPSGLRFRPQVELLESRLAPSGVPTAVFLPTALSSLPALGANEYHAAANGVALTYALASQSPTGTADSLVAATPQTPANSRADAAIRAVGLSGSVLSAAGTDATNASYRIVVSITSGANPGPRQEGGAPQVADEVVAGLTNSRVSAETQGGAHVQVVSGTAAARDAAGVQIVSPGVGPTPADRDVAEAKRSAPQTSATSEMTLFVNKATGNIGPTGGNAVSSVAVGVSSPQVQDHAGGAMPASETVVAATARMSGGRAAEPSFQATSIQVGVTATGAAPALAPPLIPSLVPGVWAHAASGGAREIGLTATAAQRKALALGLRYLYPDMTDDQIAQAAGVSRRTLFRWEEYVAVKKALRDLYKRPRGFKDRDGKIEGWIEEE